jgi:hypothetical protein
MFIEKITKLLYVGDKIRDDIKDGDRKQMLVNFIYDLDKINKPHNRTREISRKQLMGSWAYRNLAGFVLKLLRNKLFVTACFDYNDKNNLTKCLNAFMFENYSFMSFQDESSYVNLIKTISLIENKPAFEYLFQNVGHALHDYRNLAECIQFRDGKLVLKLKGSQIPVYSGPKFICFSPFPDDTTLSTIQDIYDCKHDTFRRENLHPSDTSITTSKNSYGAVLFTIPCAEIFRGRKAKSFGTREFQKSTVATVMFTGKKLIDIDGEDIPDVDLNSEKLRWDPQGLRFHWRKRIGGDKWENLEIDMEGEEFETTNFKIRFPLHPKNSCIKKSRTNFRCDFPVEDDNKRNEPMSLFIQYLYGLNISNLNILENYFDKPTFEMIEKYYNEGIYSLKNSNKRKLDEDILKAEI